MTRVNLSILAGTACALLLAMPLTAANVPAAKANKNKPAITAIRSAWSPEILSGKITMVDPNQKLMVMQTPDGVAFDMVVTPHTRMRLGDHATTLKDLTQDVNKPISVRFIPERRGDVAESIQIGG